MSLQFVAAYTGALEVAANDGASQFSFHGTNLTNNGGMNRLMGDIATAGETGNFASVPVDGR